MIQLRRSMFPIAAGLALSLAAANAQPLASGAPDDSRSLQAPQEAGPERPRSDVFDAIGRFFDEGAANFRSHLSGAKRSADELGKEAVSNTRGAADTAQSAFNAFRPSTRMVQGRVACMTAPNGAPDCQSAAQSLCQRHGYVGGSSMDFTSSERCPPELLRSREVARRGCVTETFISRAMCQ